MEYESKRGFQYHACLPYATETQDAALTELDAIVSDLESLLTSDEVHRHDFGTDYAPLVWPRVRDLFAWCRRKLVVPLAIRRKLTKLFLAAAMTSVEPVLFVRYGSACLALWKSSEASNELLHETDLVEWDQMIRVVRNQVLLSPSATSADACGQIYEQRTAFNFFSLVKNGTPAKVSLALARRFRSTVTATEKIRDQLLNDILTFLGPNTHDPSDLLVMESFSALIPMRGRAADQFIPFLYNLRLKVNEGLFYQSVVPAIAEFAKLRHDRHKESLRLSDDQLDVVFQAALRAFDIPLMSTQASKSKKATMRQSRPTLGMSGSGARLLHHAGSGYNTKAHAVNSAAFARLVVYCLDTRVLDRLNSLVNAVKSFFHPSNAGPWSTLIAITLGAVTTEFSERLHEYQDIESTAVEKLVLIQRPLVLMGVHSPIPFVVNASLDILRYLALFKPHLVCPIVLSEVYPTLQHGLHQANRLANSIAMLSRLAVPLASELQYRMHLTTLMELALPNLDGNDTKRCMLTLDLFQALATVTVFEDVSDPMSIAKASQVLPECVHALETQGSQQHLDLDQETLQMVVDGTTAAYPEILQFYIRRVFDLLETMSEQRLGSAAAASVLRVLLACSPPIFAKMLNVAVEEISNPQQQNHDAFAQVCGSFVRANCGVAFPKLWKVLAVNIREEILENQAGLGRVALSKDHNLLRNLSVLNMCLLACNSNVCFRFGKELKDLLMLIREHVGSSVVYTVANTLHHAIAALTSWNVVLPPPGSFRGLEDSSQTTPAVELTIEAVGYKNLEWNVPTSSSRAFALDLFTQNVDYSLKVINENVSQASKNVLAEDAVTNSLIYIRTAVGSIATLDTESVVAIYRKKVLNAIKKLYQELSSDDVACLKEALFVAKVWMCDFGYERTASLDQHLSGLYDYEKKPFAVRGLSKSCLPPAIIARRAQLYHHQRLAIVSQHRVLDSDSRNLIESVLVDAAFSVYPAVRRNAFSALYSPLKIFNDRDLYGHLYRLILNKLDQMIEEKSFERAQGGIALLKYRSLSVHTVGRHPSELVHFYDVCSRAAEVDFPQLSASATFLYFSTVPDVCRLGFATKRTNPAEKYVKDLVSKLVDTPLENLHWREAFFRSAALLMISQSAAFSLNPEMIKLLIEGTCIDHPEVRAYATFGILSLVQSVFHRAISRTAISDSVHSQANAELDYTSGFSLDENALENDWSSFLLHEYTPVSKLPKAQIIQAFFMPPLGSQGWIWKPSQGLTTAPLQELSLGPALEQQNLQFLADSVRLKSLVNALLDIRQIEPRPELDRLSSVYTLYYRDIVVLSAASDSFHDIILDSEKIRSPSDKVDRNWHRISAEWVCGQLLAIPVLSNANSSLVIKNALSIIEMAMEALSPETLPYWMSMISSVLSYVDHRRLVSLIQFLEAQATDMSNEGIKLSMKIALYTEALAVVQWHRPSLLNVLPQWKRFNHSLQTTRESLGDEISVAALGTLRPSSPEGLLKLSTSSLEALYEIFDTRETNLTSKVNLSLLHLLLRLLQLLGAEVCVDLLLQRGLPLLFESSAVRDDPELVTLVSNVFLELHSAHFTTESAIRVAGFLLTTMNNSVRGQWHLRIRLLLFLQPFYFNHLMTLPLKTRGDLTAMVVGILHDSQVEARDLAADTLSGIIRCSPPAEQNEYIQMLTSQFTSKVGYKAEIIERHAAVLGLGSLVGAFPYDSPPPVWVPEILATLAVNAAGDSGIVGKSAKKILGDFKKTRQDTWHIDQTVFTQDQLDDLDGVLWKNYFA